MQQLHLNHDMFGPAEFTLYEDDAFKAVTFHLPIRS